MKTMKNFAMFAAAAMMLTTSCSNDETFEQLANEAQVTFSLGLENGMNTRAISDGSGIDYLAYAIYDKDGKEVSKRFAATEFPFEAEVTLLTGETYTAVFWAQDQDADKYYDLNEFPTVKVKYGTANNDETRDAFFRSETFKVEGNANLEIVLKRPFAQLNVGVSEEEWQKAADLGKKIDQSSVQIKQAATTMNLKNGTVGDFADITYTAAVIPREALKVDIDCDGREETYKYLSMSYFLAADDSDGAYKTTLDDLKFTFIDEDGATAVFERGLENVPVQRNHRTNIIGFGEGILTGNYSVKVVLDPLYDGEHNLTNENVWEKNLGIYTEEALAGLTIQIPHFWHIRNGYILEPMPERWDEPENMNALDDTPVFYTKSYVVDGQDNTVTFEPYAYSYVAKNAFAAYNEEEDVKVTVKDLNFAGEHFGVFAGVHGRLRDNFVTDFVNVKIINNGNYLYNHTNTVEVPLTSFAASGTTTIDGCEITGSYWVGKDKDKNQYAETAMTKFNGVYDVFVANSGQYKGGDMSNRKYTTVTNNSEIGRIFVQSHGNLIVEDSKVTEIAAIPLVYGTITIKAGTNVTSMNITQLNSYAPNIKIESGAAVGELNFIYDEGKTLNTTKVKIEGTVNKITANGVEITL